MLDARLFTPLPRAVRRRVGDEYIRFALTRDGEPDVRRRTLSNRERFFGELATQPPPPWHGERIDQETFTAWHRGRRSLRDATPLIVWLVQVARANEGEAWGVNYLLDRGGFDGLGRSGRLQPRDFADLEEVYHTRIMREIVRLFGLDFQLRIPPRPIQDSVKLMARLPQRASYMLLLAGELMGTVAFARMAETGEALLAEHPEMQARVRLLMDEILIDEVGHVTFLLASLNGWQLATIRRLAQLYSAYSRRSYYGEYPGMQKDIEAMRLGIENYSLALFPERVLRRAFVPAAYWPDVYGPPPHENAIH
jgi:hypothetical protein